MRTERRAAYLGTKVGRTITFGCSSSDSSSDPSSESVSYSDSCPVGWTGAGAPGFRKVGRGAGSSSDDSIVHNYSRIPSQPF